jgi:DNA repair protein RadA/Sms
LSKVKKAYVCTDCGADYTKWAGQCGECGVWNTIIEVRLSASGSASRGSSKNNGQGFNGYAGGQQTAIVRLDEINLAELPRFSAGMDELDRVLGGGFVPGSVVLMGGHPGAGKSTLLLQTLCGLADKHEALYVTGEESLQQVAMRAKRLQLPMDKLQLLSATDVDTIVFECEKLKPKILVIDSIQVMHLADISSAPGSVSQVRESAAALTRFAKQSGAVVILVGHVTKDGGLAGPKVLEHIIDCFIMIEGTHDSRFRTLRGHKNRFGAVNELGVFAMTELGMKEVSNPSAIFLQRSDEISSGSVVLVVWEGTRPLLVEIQALVDSSNFGNPRRVAVGLEQNRLSMLLAVMHKHGGVMIGDQDVFVNAVGGVKIVETSADLALVLALVSSFRESPLSQDLVVFGEIGLSGEIRPVPSGQERLREAAKHGFKRAIVPFNNAPREKLNGMEVIAVKNLNEALEAI